MMHETRTYLADFVAMYTEDLDLRRKHLQRWRDAGFHEVVEEMDNGWIVAERGLGNPLRSRNVAADDVTLYAEDDAWRTLDPAGRDTALREFALNRPRNLTSVIGNFSFVVLAKHGRASAVRGLAALPPVYIASMSDRTVIATRLAWVAALLQSPTLDVMPASLWASFSPIFPDRRTVVDGVRLVRPGEVAHLSKATADFTPFDRTWPLNIADLTKDDDQSLQITMVDEVRAAIVREFSSVDTNLLSFSGGCDSAAIAHIAAHAKKPLTTATMYVDEHLNGARTRALLRDQSARIPFDAMGLVEYNAPAMARGSSATARLILPQIGSILRELPALVLHSGATTIATGIGADEVFGGYTTLNEWIQSRTFRSTLKWAKNPTGRRDTIRWLRTHLHALRSGIQLPIPKQLPRYLVDCPRQDYDTWREQQFAEALPLATPRLSLRLARHYHDGIPSYWESASHVGIRPVFPFISRILDDLSAQLHPETLVGGGTKGPLRRHLRTLVPAQDLLRVKNSNGLTPQDEEFCRRPMGPEIARLLNQDSHTIALPDYFHAKRIEEILEGIETCHSVR